MSSNCAPLVKNYRNYIKDLNKNSSNKSKVKIFLNGFFGDKYPEQYYLVEGEK